MNTRIQQYQSAPEANDLAKAAVTGITKGAQFETAVSSAAAQAQAMVQARFIMAMQRPRDLDQARITLLKACARPRFAATALYSKPIGRDRIEGPSIRFAEEVARAMGNVDIQTPVTYDDREKRIVRVMVTDLESNATYSTEVTIQKTVERRQVRDGQVVVGSRTNSTGQTVYLVEATDDDLLNKQNALVSKALRTNILRVVPSDIVEEAIEAAVRTVNTEDSADPDAARKRVADAFAQVGVSPSELKKYLGHELSSCSPLELADLRKVYASIKDGEATWADHAKSRAAEPTQQDSGAAQPPRRGVASVREKMNARQPAQSDGPEIDPYTGEVIPDHVGRQPGQEG